MKRVSISEAKAKLIRLIAEIDATDEEIVNDGGLRKGALPPALLRGPRAGIVLLHALERSTEKLPTRDIKVAEARMQKHLKRREGD